MSKLIPNVNAEQTPESKTSDIVFRDGLPFSVQFDDIYFSATNGLEESRYNFIQHNYLNERWSELSKAEEHSHFIIAETGFGSGLNFLACCNLWNRISPSHHHLYFMSVEKYPLSKEQLIKSLEIWPELKGEAARLIEQYPCTTPGLHSINIFNNITLQLFIGDINEALTQWLPYISEHPEHVAQQETQQEALQKLKVDAWFLDGFAPSKNPDMWSHNLFEHMVILSNIDSTFSTFTAAGDVRRGLQSVGFTVKKDKGFGKKREMLYGHLEKRALESSWFKNNMSSNWSSYHFPAFKNKTAVVIGAGLAGCITAYELALKGWHVTLIEQRDKIADGTSGNRQSILYSRLSWPADYLTAFNLSALQFSSAYFKSIFNKFEMGTEYGEFCGTLQLVYNEKEQKRLNAVYQALNKSNPDFCDFVKREDTKNVTGIDIDYDGVLFKKSGWINPYNVCTKITQHERISILTSTQVEKITQEKTTWKSNIRTHDLARTINSDIVVVCNSLDAQTFFNDYEFPIKNIRGQVSHFSASPESKKLKTVICHKGYTAPAFLDKHDTGATFTLHENSADLLHDDHVYNWNLLNDYLPSIANKLEESAHALKNQHAMSGRTGYRCTTTDYLPIAGAASDYTQLVEHFKEFRHHANKPLMEKLSHKTGLFINIAHGSRGLCSIPVVATHIASLVSGTPSPLSQKMQTELHPARFAIRDLKRRKI